MVETSANVFTINEANIANILAGTTQPAVLTHQESIGETSNTSHEHLPK